jgi:hypothetical protein
MIGEGKDRRKASHDMFGGARWPNMRPTLDEIEETIVRMETRFSSSSHPEVKRLVALYRALIPRFEADLKDRRDVALSKGAALMLIRAAAEASDERKSDRK